MCKIALFALLAGCNATALPLPDSPPASEVVSAPPAPESELPPSPDLGRDLSDLAGSRPAGSECVPAAADVSCTLPPGEGGCEPGYCLVGAP